MEVLEDNINISSTDDLWKYMDLYKFLYFVQKNKIYFSRIDQFDDPLEGLSDKIIFDKFIHDQTPTFENFNPSFTEEQRTQAIKLSQKWLKYIKEVSEITQLSQYVSCWYMSKRESMAMWDLYSGLNSVAIRFNAVELVQLFKDQAKKHSDHSYNYMIIGNVCYRDLYPPNVDPTELQSIDNKFSITKKDSSYSHENEFRFIVNREPIDKNILGFEMDFPVLSSLNFNIITHPKMDDWKFPIIQRLLEKYNLEKKLSKSTIQIRKTQP